MYVYAVLTNSIHVYCIVLWIIILDGSYVRFAWFEFWFWLARQFCVHLSVTVLQTCHYKNIHAIRMVYKIVYIPRGRINRNEGETRVEAEEESERVNVSFIHVYTNIKWKIMENHAHTTHTEQANTSFTYFVLNFLLCEQKHWNRVRNNKKSKKKENRKKNSSLPHCHCRCRF